MRKTKKVNALFDEARANSADSLSRLNEAEKHWDRRELHRAAEKGWAATTQATNALVLAYCGVEPEASGNKDTYGALSHLIKEVPELKRMKDCYTGLLVSLYGLVLCDGSMDPLEDTIEDIRAAAAYVKDAERLAGVEVVDG